MSNLMNGYAMCDAAKTKWDLLFSSHTTNSSWITSDKKTIGIPCKRHEMYESQSRELS